MASERKENPSALASANDQNPGSNRTCGTLSGDAGVVDSLNPADYDLDPRIAGRLKKNDAGLVPAVVQDADSGKVLMLAWMDEHALAYALATRRGTYWSRSRQEYWIKGMTSGHFQFVHEIRLDCDGDTVLMTVDQTGAACHTGTFTCFDSDLLLDDALGGESVVQATDKQATGGPTTDKQATDSATA